MLFGRACWVEHARSAPPHCDPIPMDCRWAGSPPKPVQDFSSDRREPLTRASGCLLPSWGGY